MHHGTHLYVELSSSTGVQTVLKTLSRAIAKLLLHSLHCRFEHLIDTSNWELAHIARTDR